MTDRVVVIPEIFAEALSTAVSLAQNFQSLVPPTPGPTALGINDLRQLTQQSDELLTTVRAMWNDLPGHDQLSEITATSLNVTIPIDLPIFKFAPAYILALAALANQLKDDLSTPFSTSTFGALTFGAKTTAKTSSCLATLKTKGLVLATPEYSDFFVLTEDGSSKIRELRASALLELPADSGDNIIPIGPEIAKCFKLKKAYVALIVIANHLGESLDSVFTSRNLGELFIDTPYSKIFHTKVGEVVGALRDEGLINLCSSEIGTYSLKDLAKDRIDNLRAAL